MTALTIRLPTSVHLKIKELAVRDGVSVSQFIASATAEKMASVLTLDYPRAEAAQGRRDDFLAVLDSVPDAPPLAGEPLNLSHSHGPANIVTAVPVANEAITSAPFNGPPAMAATNSAEYSSPQGKSAHAVPSTNGAAVPVPPTSWRVRCQTLRAASSSQMG